MLTSSAAQKTAKRNLSRVFVQLAITLVLLCVFLVVLDVMRNGLHLFSQETIRKIFHAVSNPFIGLFIGLLTTAILQSSSTITSMVVAFVAAGTLSLDNAIPIIMGANIGTTITSIIVSFGHITRKKEFKKALAAASIHNFFNIISTIILLPLEYYTHFLSDLSSYISGKLHNLDTPGFFHTPELGRFTIQPISDFLVGLMPNAYVIMIVSTIMLFFTLQGFRLLSKSLLMDAEGRVETLLFGTPFKALTWGTFLTAFLHSSSVTTSLVVPLVATNRVPLKNAFPFVMGANIGTTFTALIAAISKSEEALSIALVHLLFNVIGALILYPIPAVRAFPIACARLLGKATLKYRLVGFAYLMLTFFIIPFMLIYTSSTKSSSQHPPVDSVKVEKQGR